MHFWSFDFMWNDTKISTPPPLPPPELHTSSSKIQSLFHPVVHQFPSSVFFWLLHSLCPVWLSTRSFSCSPTPPPPPPHRFIFSEGSISLSEQLRTYPSPDPTLTLTCYHLPVVGLGEGWVCSYTETDIDPFPLQIMTRAVREGGAWTWAIGTRKWFTVASCMNNTEVFFSCFVSKWHQYC